MQSRIGGRTVGMWPRAELLAVGLVCLVIPGKSTHRSGQPETGSEGSRHSSESEPRVSVLVVVEPSVGIGSSVGVGVELEVGVGPSAGDCPSVFSRARDLLLYFV